MSEKTGPTKTEATLPKIFLFVQASYPNGDVVGAALAEDGAFLAQHLSSNRIWLKHELGLNSRWKHGAYATHYPNGYELVDLTELTDAELDKHEAFMAATKLNWETPNG